MPRMFGKQLPRPAMGYCIIYFNTNLAGNSLDCYGTVGRFCCSVPLLTGGAGNFTNPPVFIDLAAGDLRLESNSPCINAGCNAYVSTITDLDGNTRIAGGTVDIGAYEFQGPSSQISYAWLESYGLPVDGSADFKDTDGDGLSNLQEWLAGTDPTNATSTLRLLVSSVAVSEVTLTWQSDTNHAYFLQRATDLSARSCFSCIASNIAGAMETTSFVHTNPPTTGPALYRLGVQVP